MRETLFHSHNPRLIRFQRWFSTCKGAHASLLVFAVAGPVGLAFWPFGKWLDSHLGKWIALPDIDHRTWRFVLLAAVVSPLVETLLYQWAIFRLALLNSFVRRRAWIPAWVSAAIFGGQHFYSAGYIVVCFAAGLVLAYGFWLSGTFKRGYWVIAGSHCALNIAGLALTW
jgi:hypothetical protein